MAVGRQRTIHHWKFWGSLSAVDGTQLPGVNWSSSSYLPVKYCHGHQHAAAAILTNIVMAVTTQAPSSQWLWVILCSLWGFNAFLAQWPGLHMCLVMGSIMFSAHLWAKEQTSGYLWLDSQALPWDHGVAPSHLCNKVEAILLIPNCTMWKVEEEWGREGNRLIRVCQATINV